MFDNEKLAQAPQGQESESRVTSFWAEIPQDDVIPIALWRVPQAGQPEFLETFYLTRDAYPSEYDFYQEVKSNYGGGKYEIRVTNSNGQWVKRPQFCIGGRPKRLDDEPPAVQVTQQESGTDKLIALMIQNQREDKQMMLAVLEKIANRPEPDKLGELEKYAAIMGRFSGAPEKKKSFVEEMTELKTAAELMGFAPAGAGGQSEIDSLAQLANPFFSFLTESKKADAAKEAAAARYQQPAPPAAALPAPAPQAPAPAVAAAPVERSLALVNAAGFDNVIAQLLVAAAAKMPPAMVAAKLVEVSPDKELLKEFLMRDDALAQMNLKNPAVQQHWEWFGQVAIESLTLLGVTFDDSDANATATDAGAAPGAAGGAANAAGDDQGRQAGDGGHAQADVSPGATGQKRASRKKSGAGAGEKATA
jgi:hypothetical protein